MTKTITVFVPCDVVPIRVRYGYGASVSPIELTVLEAIAAGSHGTEELADLLCLSERMILDVIADLWRRGYVVLDFRQGEVHLSAAAATRAAQDALGDLPGVESGTSVVKLMYERLSGHVMPRGGLRQPADQRLAVPVEGTGSSIEDASPAELLNAVRQAVSRGRAAAGGWQRRVVSAHLSPAQLRAANERMWLPLDVQVGLDRMTERLRVTVVGSLLPETRRMEAARRLVRLAEQYPDHGFVQALRAEIDPEYTDPPALEELIARLERQAGEAATYRAGTRAQRHRDLRQTAFQAANQLAARVAQEVTATPLFGRAEERAALHEIIDDAQTQIVLTCPRILPGALEEFLEPLRAALHRGVQVVIVWGRRHDEDLEPAVQRALMQLSRPYGRPAGDGEPETRSLQVLWSARPARIHVTLAVADDRTALVTGDALLGSPGKSAATQLGVRLRAPRPEGRCLAIERLLEWTGHAIPEHRLANAMYSRYEDFHRLNPDRNGEEHNPDAAADRIRDDAISQIPGDPPETDEDLDPARLAAWSRGWVELADRLRRLLVARGLPWARLVEDDEHRELMGRAENAATARLVVGSPELDHAALSDRMLFLLRERLAAGVEVTLAHGPVAPDEQEDKAKALVELSGHHNFHLRQFKTNARFLICDDEIAIGSYRYLSASARGAQSTQYHSELSVLLAASSLADAVAGWLAGPGSSAPAQPGPQPLPVPGVTKMASPVGLSSATALPAQRLLDRVAAAAGEIERTRIIRQVLGEEPDPWPVLDYLRQAGAGAAVLRVATAASWNRPGKTAEAGREWLLGDLWRSGQFVEAAILRSELPNPDLRPSVPLVRIAAARGTPAVAEALMEAALGQPAPAEHTLLGVVCAAELLLGPTRGPGAWDGQEIFDVLGLLRSDLPEPWAGLASAACGYWMATGLPMPLPAIRAAIRRARRAEQVEEDWRTLTGALSLAAQTTLAPVQGKKAHAYLFHPDHAFGELLTAVDARKLDEVVAWTRRADIADLGLLLDAVTAEVSPGAALAGAPRRAYLARLTAVVEAAKDVAADGPDDEHKTPIPSQAQTVARHLRTEWADLTDATAQMTEPERFLADAILNDLSIVRDWVTA